MPKYKTHLSAGFLIFFFIILILIKLQKLNFTIPQIFFYAGCCLFGSLFPDIDTKSKIQKILYYFIFIIILYLLLFKKLILACIISIITFIPLLTNHRNLTHKLWFIILIPLTIPIVTFNYNKNIFIPIFIGYLFFIIGGISHIGLDLGLKNIFKRK